MDFLDPAKKRAHNRRLFIGYFLIGITIALVSYILLLQTYYGYDINRHTGQLIQNGITFVSSHPVSADLYVNGIKKGTTDVKLAIPAGEYNFELQRSGYRTWRRTFTLEGGKVEQLTYPLLFPSKLVTVDTKRYSTKPALVTQSPDRRWLLVQPTSGVNSFDTFDLSSATTTASTVSPPNSLLTAAAGTHNLSAVEWSADNRHILLKHVFKGGSEFIIFDRASPNSSINLNKLLGTNPMQVSLRNKNSNSLYIYDSKTQILSTADAKTKLVRPLMSKVISYKTFGPNLVIYITLSSTQKNQYSVNIWDGRQSYLIRYLPSSADYQVDMASFSDTDYLVVAHKDKGLAYTYKNPLAQAKKSQLPTPFAALKISQTEFISFSPNSRFIAVQGGRRFAVYDLEKSKLYYYQLQQGVPAGNKATWMDGYRLSIAIENRATVFDFDGTNQQILTASYTGIKPFFNSDYSSLYNIAPAKALAGRSALTRTELKVQ